jgi:uncharacterized surface protein with fasciclin (FAS1) repeats
MLKLVGFSFEDLPRILTLPNSSIIVLPSVSLLEVDCARDCTRIIFGFLASFRTSYVVVLSASVTMLTSSSSLAKIQPNPTQPNPTHTLSSTVDTICDMDDSSVFCSIVSNVTEDTPELGISLEENDYTIFVPTDAAFALVADTLKELSAAEVSRIIFFHFYEGSMLTYDELNCGEKLVSLSNDGRIDDSRTKCNEDGKYQKGTGNREWPRISSMDYMACTAVIHTIDHVMFPVYLSQFG